MDKKNILAMKKNNHPLIFAQHPYTYLFFTVFLLIPIINSCKTPAIIATQTIMQADEFNNKRRYNKAISYYNKYLSISPTLGVYRNT